MEKNYELVQKAKSGDVDAFEALLQSKHDKLYRTAFLYVRSKEDALDVLQETAYQAFVSIKNIKQLEYFDTWIIRILIRVAYAFLREKNSLILDDEITNTLESDVDIEETSSGHLDLSEAISTLNPDYQSVIILFYYHDLPILDISEIIDKPQNTVKTYLRRAKVELKNYLEEGELDYEKRYI